MLALKYTVLSIRANKCFSLTRPPTSNVANLTPLAISQHPFVFDKL